MAHFPKGVGHIAPWLLSEIHKRLDYIEINYGAASGDRTHDILSHSQAFCR